MQENRSSRLHLKLAQVACLLMMALLTSSGLGLFAQNEKKFAKGAELNVQFGLTTVYDDNILRYSEKYLDRFINQEDPGRFHIDTYDDVVLNPSLQITGTYRLFGKLKSELDLDYSPRFYFVNGIKNWSYFGIGFRQYFTKRASFKLIYGYIPSYYIRHFQDDDWYAIYGDVPEQYQPMDFAKNNYGIWIQNTFFRSTTVRLSFYYAQYFYNKHFTEYDCNDLTFGARIYQRASDMFRLELAYEYSSSDAKGYDGTRETKADSDEADASYFENGLQARVTWEIPWYRKLEHSLDLECGFQKRYYTSEHYLELDPLHAGRMDNIWQVSASYDLELIRSLRMKVFYNWFMRNTDTRAEQNKEYVSAEKDYHQNLFGLELIYELNFK